MTILALEFSTERRSVALARDGAVLAEAVQQDGSRGTNALGLIGRALAGSNIAREEIEVIAVGLGPGSYTGIRAAIAVAQGWQLARSVKLLGVSSAEALAAQARADNLLGTVDVVIDAQRGEFYLATWEISAVERKETSSLKIVSGGEIKARQATGRICVGPLMNKAMFPAAATIAGLAAQRTDFIPGDELVPIYLRETTFVKAPIGKTLS